MFARRTPRFVTLIGAAVALLPAAVTAQGTPQSKALSPELASAKAALEKYQDPVLAVHDGYFSTIGCIEYSVAGGQGDMAYPKGGMGVHFLNAGLIGPTLDPSKPQVLIYEPVSGGKLRLAAAEWFVPVQLSKEAPTIFGHKLMGPMEGHEPVIPAAMHHWDLHVWLWKTNPAGMFSPTNPGVACGKSGHAYSFDDKPPKMVMP